MSTQVVELLRRAQWSLIRLEYEYTSNPSNYRSVKEVKKKNYTRSKTLEMHLFAPPKILLGRRGKYINK